MFRYAFHFQCLVHIYAKLKPSVFPSCFSVFFFVHRSIHISSFVSKAVIVINWSDIFCVEHQLDQEWLQTKVNQCEFFHPQIGRNPQLLRLNVMKFIENVKSSIDFEFSSFSALFQIKENEICIYTYDSRMVNKYSYSAYAESFVHALASTTGTMAA